jgi:hypothetical protein
VKLLRTVLYVEALALLAWAVAAGLFPAWVTETLGDQAPLAEEAWVRLTAVQALGFAMMMWLTAVEIERRWWFSWAFVITAAGVALVATWAAVANLFDARSPRLWWFLAAAAVLKAAALVVGLAKTGLERQPE